MPKYNGTGPLGFGPGTGWGLGPCGAGMGWRGVGEEDLVGIEIWFSSIRKGRKTSIRGRS